MEKQKSMISSAESLMKESRNVTRIDRIDQDAIEPLQRLVKSINEESNLHDKGVVLYHQRLVRILSNRLRMQRDIEAHPEILEEKIEAPVILHGMPRTGSTKSQKILSMSDDFNWLSFWEIFNPSLYTGSRDESPQPRIDDTLAFEQYLNRESPELVKGHKLSVMEPEEESYLLEHSLLTPVFFGWSIVNGYLNWLTEQDQTLQFKFLRDALKYLQWQGLADRNKRWLLKCPLYYGLEHQLLNVFPDACLVMTHRHPLSTIPSGMCLLELYFQPYTHDVPDSKALLMGFSGSMERHLQNRREIADLNLIDIDYREMLVNPETAIRKIYTFCEIELSPASLKKMMDWNDSNPKDKHGKHIYSFKQCGLTEEEITDQFSDYIRFLEEEKMHS